ncbi:hypothetical protein GUITHDRAFT_41551, partial [Guillardia theta CCMP2712]
DAVMIVTRYIDRSDMFDDLYVAMQAREDIKDLIKVQEARAPVIKFRMDDFEFKLSMARLNYATLPEDFDVTDDKHLKNVDPESVASLNSVRVTDTIRSLVPNLISFKYCIQALKFWAKKRGVYNNGLGFLGSISLEIMAARICQLYPKALPSRLLYFFFFTYCQWKWPQPVELAEIVANSHDLNLPVWGYGATEMSDRRHLMPIISPCYPAQNTAALVSRSTLKIMKEMFIRAMGVCKQIHEGKAGWCDLFEPVDLFSTYANFLQIQASARSKADHNMWKGFCAANIHNMISYLERCPDAYLDRAHPIQRSYAKPRKGEQDQYEHLWYVGLKFDHD